MWARPCKASVVRESALADKKVMKAWLAVSKTR